jgi:hypothetical protein
LEEACFLNKKLFFYNLYMSRSDARPPRGLPVQPEAGQDARSRVTGNGIYVFYFCVKDEKNHFNFKY